MEPLDLLDNNFKQCLWPNVLPQLNYQERTKFLNACKYFNVIANQYVGHIVIQNKHLILDGKNIFDQTLITLIESSSTELQKSALVASFLAPKSSIKHIVSYPNYRNLSEESLRILDLLLNLGANPNECISVHYATPLFCALEDIKVNFEDISRISWKLIKSGTDPRIVNLSETNAFENVDWILCENEALHKKMKELELQIFDYIKITGLDQKPIPKLPQKFFDEHNRLMNDIHSTYNPDPWGEALWDQQYGGSSSRSMDVVR